MLAYVVHTCAHHVFRAAMTARFLAHVAVFVLAAVALGVGMCSYDSLRFAITGAPPCGACWAPGR